jgi:uncharacterized protein YbjT (DUF2867 family)
MVDNIYFTQSYFMEVSKTFFVTGATGNQGGAVVNSLLANGYSVKALTRNPDAPKAKILKEKGAHIIKGDLDDPATYAEHVKI